MLSTAPKLRGAFSDTEDFLDHGMVSANRCSSRTSSISSWTENIKPSFTKKVKFQSVLEGEPVVFKCKLVACPLPTILWFHNNRSVARGHRRRICTESAMHMHTSSLIIDSVKEKDSGSYKVMAINAEGSAESTASLLVSLREEQSANYLSFIRRSAKAHKSMDALAEQRKDRKFRVDLRYVGSPFDKMSKVHRGRSRSKYALVRTVYFHSGSVRHEEESHKKSKRLETASERAPSPPAMFDGSDRFNDRFSDIYCDRRTGARFSDKFSDRCSDRYSERFSDTESLHNEVRTKLSTLQRAVRQKKRLSISTMSSSEFESESVASESSYADYVEQLRVKPALFPDVQHSKRAFNFGESQSLDVNKETFKPSVRHSFEPQSRTRAIQIIKGEQVDLVEPQSQTKTEKYSETFELENVQCFDDPAQRISGLQGRLTECKVECPTKDVEPYIYEPPFSESFAHKEAASTDIREPAGTKAAKNKFRLIKSTRDHLPPETTEHIATTKLTDDDDPSFEGSYESQDVENRELEEKCVSLPIRKWSQGNRMSEDKTFHSECELPMPVELLYMEPEGHIYTQQEIAEVTTKETEAMDCFHTCPTVKAKEIEPETVTVSTPQLPKVEIRAEEREKEEQSMVPPPSLLVKMHAVAKPKIKGTEGETIHVEEKCAGQSLREQYERSLEAERIECEGKLLALRIKKWQKGMQVTQGEIFQPQIGQLMADKTPYKEFEPVAASVSTTQSSKVEIRVEERKDEEQLMVPQPSLRVEMHTVARPKIKRTEGATENVEDICAGESLSEQYERSLEAEQIECEETFLALRIQKLQKDMHITQEETFKPEMSLLIADKTPLKEIEPEAATVSTAQSPTVPIRAHKKEDEEELMVPQPSLTIKMHSVAKPKIKGTDGATENIEEKCTGESLREQHQRSPLAKWIEDEEKLMALQIMKRQKGMQMTRGETFQPEMSPLIADETPLKEIEPEAATVSTPQLLRVEVRAEERKDEEHVMVPQPSLRVNVNRVARPKINKTKGAAKNVDDKCAGEFLREHYESSLEAERIECEEKHLASRINKWLKDMQVTQEDTFQPEMHLLMADKTLYKEIEPEAASVSTLQSPRVEVRAEEREGEEQLLVQQPSLETKMHAVVRARIKGTEGATENVENKSAAESLREQYERTPEAQRVECEEKLLALRINKWQKDIQVTQKETLQSEMQLLMADETPYKDIEHVDKIVSIPQSPRVEVRVEKREEDEQLLVPQPSLGGKCHTVSRPKIKGTEGATENIEDKCAGESLRDQHPRNLEAERIECEEKLLALRIMKRQKGMQITQEETFQPEMGPQKADVTPYKEIEPKVATVSTPQFPKVEIRAEEREDEEQKIVGQPSFRGKMHSAAKPKIEKTEGATENIEDKCAGESLRDQHPRSLEAERIECEEKLLALRIMKRQKGMQITQEETFQPEMGPQKADVTPYKEIEPKVATVSTPQFPKVEIRAEEREDEEQKIVGQPSFRGKMHSAAKPKIEKTEGVTENIEDKCVGESFREQYQSSLDAERIKCEKKLLALRIMKRKKGIQMTEEETFQPEMGLLMADETPYKEIEPEAATVSMPESPKVQVRLQETEDEKQLLVSQPSLKVNMHTVARPKIKGTEGGTEDTCAGESLMEQYERCLEAERIECEEKLLALRIKKGQKGMQVTQEETFHPEMCLLKADETPYMEPEGPAYTESEKDMHNLHIDQAMAVTKPRSNEADYTVEKDQTLPLSLAPRGERQKEILETVSALQGQKYSGNKSKAGDEKFLFEKTSEDHELQLSMENISELKKCEQFVSEEEALTKRIMKWQKDVLMEQEEARKPDSYPLQVKGSRMSSFGKTAKEKFLMSEQGTDQKSNSLQWLPVEELSTEGLETSMQRDSEYFVSEEEALAQRLLKWKTDVIEQEEAAEQEAISDNFSAPHMPLAYVAGAPCKPSHIGVDTCEQKSQEEPVAAGGAIAQMKHLHIQGAAGYELSPPSDSALPQHAVLSGPVDSFSAPKEDCDASPVNKTYTPSSHTFVCSGSDEHSFQLGSPSPFYSPQVTETTERKQIREGYTTSVHKPSSQSIQKGLERVIKTPLENSTRKQHIDLVAGGKKQKSQELVTLEGFDRAEHESATKKEKRTQGPDDSETSMMVKEIGMSALSCRPIFVKETSSLKVRTGEMSVLSCQFQGDPPPQVTWLKDGHSLAHNPDYDITVKANKSKLTIYYPTTDHEGTYDCVINNIHGKNICSTTLEISNKKAVKDSQEVAVKEKFERGDTHWGNQEETSIETSKEILQVSQPLSHQYISTDECHSPSPPVEIRVDVPSPGPVVTDTSSEDKPHGCAEKISDDRVYHTGKHKLSFSYDGVGEAPCVMKELHSLTCSEGSTAVLECIITAKPSSEVTWFCNNICLETTLPKYRAEVDGKVHRLYISYFSCAEAGVYKCVARNKMGEVSSICDVSFQDDKLLDDFREDQVIIEQTKKLTVLHTPSEVAPHPRCSAYRELQPISGCGLQQSAAVIKVSQLKQTFESDSAATLMAPPLSQKQKEETLVPKEFIPAVAIHHDEHLEHSIKPKNDNIDTHYDVTLATSMSTNSSKPTQTILSASSLRSSGSPQLTTSEDNGPGTSIILEYVEEVAVKQSAEKVLESPELIELTPRKPAGFHEEMMPGQREEQICEKNSIIPFQADIISSEKRLVKISVPTSKAEKSQIINHSLESEKQRETISSENAVDAHSYADDAPREEQCTDVVQNKKQDLQQSNNEPHMVENILIPEPSFDSGVFVSLPTTEADVLQEEQFVCGDVVVPSMKTVKASKIVDVLENLEPNVSSRVQYAASQTENHIIPEAKEEGSGSVGIMEEEVTFGAVYEYYNPPTDWGRPLSPESEMSIEIGSTVSDEVGEVAEKFYTPSSSTEISQPTFHTPKSPSFFQTPSSDTPGGFKTPLEYPCSPFEEKRHSTDLSERFFSPVLVLTTADDENLEMMPLEINMEDTYKVSRSRGSLGLATHQDKVQGIPPAFLKPLMKKRVFENDSLTFLAEVFGLPPPEVKWFCNKTRLIVDDRIIMDRDGDSVTLTIHNVSKADQGEYICEAVNDVGEARSVALVMVVSQEARILPAPPAVTHQHVMEFDVENDDSSRSPSPQEILLEVELDESEVKEFEKQVKIITIPEYTADSKSMIISLDVIPSIYEEGAVDFVTQEHDDLKIAFEVTEMPPRFINPICDMETSEGTIVMFECSLMGIPSPIVAWFKDGKTIPYNNKRYQHSSDGDNHFLKICNVTVQDGGVYTCSAINVVGETLCRASLVVLSAKTPAGQTRGRELTSVSLSSAKVQPQKFDLLVSNPSVDSEQVSEIELEFDFQQEADESQRAVRLVAKTDSKMSEDHYMSINFDVFAEPAKDDKVEFRGKSSDVCSFQFQVTETAPRCVIPLTDVTTAVGTPVILQCLVSGKPNPTAEWYKDGERVTDIRYIIQEKTIGHFNLLITNVSHSDAGEYKCIIQNAAGWTETSALLKVY
ncbi:uncharacterized protein [Nerophis lumbriciformis]|uniref:uncharacterized protein n=1 Tax=Nerophis lumbriciformis TaxID=546530 RepID=UPI003BAA63CF